MVMAMVPINMQINRSFVSVFICISTSDSVSFLSLTKIFYFIPEF